MVDTNLLYLMTNSISYLIPLNWRNHIFGDFTKTYKSSYFHSKSVKINEIYILQSKLSYEDRTAIQIVSVITNLKNRKQNFMKTRTFYLTKMHNAKL